MSGLRCSFLAFCDFAQRGSTTCTDKTLQKICTDCDIYSDILDQNRVDIQFRKFTGNYKKSVDYDEFLEFIRGPFSDAYACAYRISKKAAISEIKRKIAGGMPSTCNTTEIDCEVGLQMLCDPRLYTGAQRARFDPETGELLKNDDERVECTGYVNGYKNMNTYDKVHPPKKHHCR